MRIGSLVVVAVLAFGAGLALRGWSGETATVAPKAATALDPDRTFRPIRLARADPGALQRPALEPSPATPGAPAAPVPATAAPVAAPGGAPAASAPEAATPAPEPAAPLKPDGVALPEPSPTSHFDSEG